MEFSPQKSREIIFQLLFSFEVNQGDNEELVPFLMEELAVSKKNVRAGYARALSIWHERHSLDKLISDHSKEYALDRIKLVEKNVLRLALYELLMEKKLNAKIVISEAHRLTRKFGTPEGASFVHALLDNILGTEPAGHETPLSSPECEATV